MWFHTGQKHLYIYPQYLLEQFRAASSVCSDRFCLFVPEKDRSRILTLSGIIRLLFEWRGVACQYFMPINFTISLKSYNRPSCVCFPRAGVCLDVCRESSQVCLWADSFNHTENDAQSVSVAHLLKCNSKQTSHLVSNIFFLNVKQSMPRWKEVASYSFPFIYLI